MGTLKDKLQRVVIKPPSVLQLIALAFTAYFLAQCMLGSDKKVVEWESKAKTVLAQNDSLRKAVVASNSVVDSLDAVNRTKVAEIDRLNAAIRTRKVKADTIRLTLKQTLPDTCKPALELADEYRTQAEGLQQLVDSSAVVIETQQVQIDTLRTINLNLTNSNDKLIKLVNTAPTPKRTKLRRARTFVLGALTGIAVYHVAR
jgi:hypothetical protein